jgi:hypothetical protein
MRERRPAPEQQVEPRSERAGGSLQARDAQQLASQMGNVAFTALARSLARQPDEDTIAFPPDHIYPGGAARAPAIGPDGILEFPPDYIGPTEGPTVGPDGILEFPPDYIGPTEGPTVGPDGILEFPPDYIGPSDEGSAGETIEFPPDYITPDSSGAGAAAGAAGGSVG